MRLKYSVKDGNAIITGADDIGTLIVIPKEIDGYPVKEIERKAFLGIKGLKSVEIPESVTAIGDWAFAQCIHLKEIKVNSGNKELWGRGVFEGCVRLEKIDTNKGEASAVLAAMTANRLSSDFLLRDSELGEKEWFEKWDLALSNLLSKDDLDGFSDRALCGEEDVSYDGVGMVDGEMPGESAGYIIEQNKNKCYLCLVRLMNSNHISEEFSEVFSRYLKKHALGCGNGSAWLAIKEDFNDTTDYLKLFLDVTSPDSDTIHAMIEDAGGLAEIKAYLINQISESKATDSFFDDLLL